MTAPKLPEGLEPVAWRYKTAHTTHLCHSRLDHYFSNDEGATYVKGEPLVRLSDAQAALQALAAEIAVLREDAARYRWLRQPPNNLNGCVYGPTSMQSSGLLRRDAYLDAAIDSALLAAKEAKQ